MSKKHTTFIGEPEEIRKEHIGNEVEKPHDPDTLKIPDENPDNLPDELPEEEK